MLPVRADNSDQEKTLVSWKEIAAFLNRAERTVKRWERERGLPVHRVPGGERGSVFAYPSELADWLKGKSSELEADDSTAGDREPDGSTVAAVASQDIPDPRLSEAIGHGSQTSKTRRIRFAVIGMAATVAIAGVCAAFAHPFGWIQQRLDAIAGNGSASSNRQVVAPVSDTEKRQAHDLYLQGRFEWNQRTPESLNRALDDFTQAIVHDPNDAHAYAGLADSYEMLYIYGNRQDDDARDKALAAARKAVQLDSSLSEAHRALGYAIWRAGNVSEAERELHLAIQLDPKDPLSHLWLSNILGGHDEQECLAEINRAQELDPASASILAIKGDRLYWMGSRDEGVALLKAAERSEPKLAIAHWYLAAIAYHAKDYPTYLKESAAAAQLRNDPWLEDVTAKLSTAYKRDSERGLLNAEFAVQESCSPPVYPILLVSRTRKAIDCLNSNRIAEALQLLEEAKANNDVEFEGFREAFNSGSLDLQNTRVAPRLAQDPRFQALVKQKTGFPKPVKPPDSGVL